MGLYHKEPSGTNHDQYDGYDLDDKRTEGRKSNRLLLMNLMNQSTIYRRHEARLARSYALRDDPRPAFLRVMSGLPGFRMIVPPYQPTAATEEEGRRSLSGATNIRIGDFSEDTIFSKNGETSDIDNRTHGSIDSRSFGQSVFQAMIATGACALGAEYAYGCYRGRASHVSSPFAPKTPAYYPLLRGDTGALGVYLFRANQQTTPLADLSSAPAIRSIALTTALSTSALFGTKVASQRYFSMEDDKGRINDYIISTSLLSSIIAGGVVGLGHLVSVYRHQRLTPTSPFHQHPQQAVVGFTAQRRMLGRHVVAACVYFSTYDGISSLLQHQGQEGTGTRETTTNDCNKDSHNNSTIGALVGGAMAGCAHATALNYHYGMWRLIPAVARAAPFHAFVFFGYQSMRNNGIQSR